MVDVIQTNEKIHVREENIVIEAIGGSREKTQKIIVIAGGSVKTAITMILESYSLYDALSFKSE